MISMQVYHKIEDRKSNELNMVSNNIVVDIWILAYDPA